MRDDERMRSARPRLSRPRSWSLATQLFAFQAVVILVVLLGAGVAAFSNAAAANADSAEDEVLDRIPDEAVKKALESLPENFRIPVLLADVEGFSYKEIAEIMDTPIGTVMSRLHRGRKALERVLWQTAEERGLVDG